MLKVGSTCLRYMNLVVILWATLCTISNACSTCHSPWIKVYEGDSTNHGVSGDLLVLENALLDGARGRYVIPELGDSGYAEELLYVFKDVFLCGISLLHVVKDTWDRFHSSGSWRFVVVCTTGAYQEIIYSLGEHTLVDTTATAVAISWYIQPAVCTFVYGNSDDGTTNAGSKAAMMDYVLSGFDLKGRIDDFTFPYNNLDIDETTGEIVGQSIYGLVFHEPDNLRWVLAMFGTDGGSNSYYWNVGEHVSGNNYNIPSGSDWYANPCWRHAYTHDENGVELDGSLAGLTAAVNAGHRVKVLMGTFSIEVDSVVIKAGIVSAQLLNQVDRINKHELSDDAYWIWQMVHTSGNVRTKGQSIGDVTNRGETNEKKTISWFVDTHLWKKVLSTKRFGLVSYGSKIDLKNAIYNGASVRVSLQFDDEPGLFIMNTELIEFGPDGELAAELLKFISTEEVAPGEFQIKDDPFWKFMLVTTESNVDIVQWRVGDHIDDGHFLEKATVNWFVNY